MGVDINPPPAADAAKIATDAPRKATFVTDQIEKPDIDNRSYRVIRLANDLEVLLAHDPDTDKASAALDVNVGAFSDEDDMPGMAHAVEHLLFMGTKKYPAENHYHQYLSSNSGSSNAYTASTSTNYFFDVAAKPANDQEPTEENPSPFHDALDIFAQFFISPLFLSETLDRELKAVDSENKKNLQSDFWRLYQLDKSLSNPKHPHCHFGTGNFEVLKTIPESKGINVRDKFMEFHDKYYSANIMKLVILGREPLDLLEKWAVEIFTAIPNKNLQRNLWTDEVPLRKSELNKICYAKPVYDKRELCLSFPIMDEDLLYRSQPSRYVIHLIGHEGPGSLMAYLKAKGWVNNLSVGAMAICPGSPGILECEMRLTEAGLQHYPEITKAFFQYVSLLRETKPQQWIFDEQRLIGDVTFKFRQKTAESRFTSKMSSSMQRPFPREWIMSGANKYREFNPTLIEQVIGSITPDNFRMSVISKTYPGDWDKREKWYKTEYKQVDMTDDFVSDLWKAIQSDASNRPKELHLPGKNRFIPTNLDVRMKEVKEPAVAPTLVRNDSKARTWWKKDDTFGVPKGSIIVRVRQPLTFATCQTAIQARLYGELVKDALEEHSYDAELAGLSYNVEFGSHGYNIEISGYNDKLSVLLEEVLLKIRHIKITDERFNIIKERIERNLRNWKLQPAYNQISFVTHSLMEEKEYPVENLLDHLATAAADDVRYFHKLLMSQAHFEILVHGNFGKEDALKMTALVESTLSARELPASEWPVSRHLILPPGSNYAFAKTLEDPENVNNCIEYWLYIGSCDDMKLRATLLVFEQIMNEPAFDQLRTKEQLGYIVFASVRISDNMMAFRILIQSEKYPQYLHSRIGAFLDTQKEQIESMSSADFETHKRSVIVRRLKKYDNLHSETSRFHSQITSGYYRFDIGQQDAEHVKEVTKKDILDFFNTYISTKSKTTAKLSVELYARGETAVEEVVATALEATPPVNAETKAVVRATIVEAILHGSADGLADVLSLRTGLSLEAATTIVKALGTSIEDVAKERSQHKDKQMEFTLSSSVTGWDNDKETKFIIDVPKWKRGLKASSAPIPAKELHEFEEVGPKL
ncbi:hypothetical protein BROUX41_004112 [Berkeleyomyces rouxiae]|uniref:uncharacterized protein n=1 Tax=Berkeleyomyces rouxiae TaxID=2035830 RepID=UPI003B76E9D9